VVIAVHDSKLDMLHVAVLQVAGDVEKFEVYRLPVGLELTDHAWTIVGVTVMCQLEAVAVDHNHRERIIFLSRIFHGIVFSSMALMDQCVT
jgi:hypothetical protein